LYYIVIRDAPDGRGREVKNWIRSEDDSLRLYCAGYDKFGNFVGNISVSWITSLDHGNLMIASDEDSHSYVIGPMDNALRIDYVRAFHRDLDIDDSTGVLYLVDSSLNYIQIRTAPHGGGIEVSTLIMTSDDAMTLYAAGYDYSGNFIKNQIVEWNTTGSLDIVNTIDTAYVFNPISAPTSGTIVATADNMRDATGTITVDPGELCKIKVRCSLNNSTSCFPEYEDTVKVYVGEHLTLWFAGFDCDGNYRGDEPLSIDSIDIGFTGTLMVENWIFTGPGQGRIIVEGIDTSGVIIVTENPASVTINKLFPSQYKLGQAYPNPFNPSTTIKFYLPRSEYVKLEIYNNIGQIVETIIHWQMTAGEHIVEFNARHLSSGVYYYRLATPNFTDVKKFILMK
jgi:hypothetical protein